MELFVGTGKAVGVMERLEKIVVTNGVGVNDRTFIISMVPNCVDEVLAVGVFETVPVGVCKVAEVRGLEIGVGFFGTQ